MESQSLCIAAKANVGNQSNLSHNITASSELDEYHIPFADYDEDSSIWGDIYDEYEDFDVCNHHWC